MERLRRLPKSIGRVWRDNKTSNIKTKNATSIGLRNGIPLRINMGEPGTTNAANTRARRSGRRSLPGDDI